MLLLKVRRIIVLGLCIFSVTACSFSEVYLKITKSGQGKISCAVPAFYFGDTVDPGLSGKGLENDLKRDLDLSGFFNTGLSANDVRQLRLKENRVSALSPGTWNNIGADIVVKSKISTTPDMIKAHVYAFNAADGRGVFAKKYSIGAGKYNTLIHMIANDIIYNVTGEQGMCLSKLVFVSSRTGKKEVYVSDYDGRNIKQVTKDNSIIISPFWSPSGNQLVYTSFRYTMPRIILHDISTGKRRFLAKFPGLNTSGPISPDGTSVLMVLSKDGNPEIYRFNLDSMKPIRLTKSKATEASPCWSPDGRKIAYVSDVTGYPQIYIMDSNGTNKKRLSYKGYYNSDPDWSPKGDKIVYTSERSGHSSVFVADLERGDVIELDTGRGKAESPAWAPDGRHIIYTYAQGGTYNLYLIDSETGEKVQLTQSNGSELSPSFTVK